MASACACLLLMTGAITQTVAQDASHVYTVSASAVPNRILLPRGSKLVFTGTLPDDSPPTTFQVRAGNTIRAKGTFEGGAWTIEADVSQERLSLLTLIFERIALNGTVARLGRISVEIIDKVPFQIAAPEVKPDGAVVVKISPSGALAADRYELLVDEKPCGTALDGSGVGQLAAATLRPGDHKLSARIVITGGGEIISDPVSFSIPARVRLLPFEEGETFDLRRGIVQPEFRWKADPDVKPTAVAFYLDDKPLGTRHKVGDVDVVRFSPERLTTGDYRLHVDVTDEAGAHYLSPYLVVHVIGDARKEFAAWKERLDVILAKPAQTEQVTVSTGPVDIVALSRITAKRLKDAYLIAQNNLDNMKIPGSLSAGDQNKLKIALQRYSAAMGNFARACRGRYGLGDNATNAQLNIIRRDSLHATELIVDADDLVREVQRHVGL